MARYLVIAHQTVGSPELLDKIRELRATDPSASFTVVVPATPVVHLLHWEPGETDEVATHQAHKAERLFSAIGADIREARVGDSSPVLCVEDAIQRGESYEAIVLSTFPQGMSRWLGLDNARSIRHRYGIPLIHVVAEPDLVTAAATGGPEGHGITP